MKNFILEFLKNNWFKLFIAGVLIGALVAHNQKVAGLF